MLHSLGQSPFMPLVLAYLSIAPAFTLTSVPVMMMDYAVMESNGRFPLERDRPWKDPSGCSVEQGLGQWEGQLLGYGGVPGGLRVWEGGLGRPVWTQPNPHPHLCSSLPLWPWKQSWG